MNKNHRKCYLRNRVTKIIKKLTIGITLVIKHSEVDSSSLLNDINHLKGVRMMMPIVDTSRDSTIERRVNLIKQIL